MTDRPYLHAYRVSDVQMPLVVAPSKRAWMSNPYLAAERCLPITMANESGWLLLSAHSFIARWTGSNDSPSSLAIDYQTGEPPYPAESNFGGGIITFRPPFLFRTSPGYNLLVRGPANHPLSGAVPLEGLVETDWTASTFTVNWKMTQEECSFNVGDPIAQLIPHRRDDLEQFDTQLRNLSDDPELEAEYLAYRDGRSQWKEEAEEASSYAQVRGWQRHYYQGKTVLGIKASEHRTRRHLKPFE